MNVSATFRYPDIRVEWEHNRLHISIAENQNRISFYLGIIPLTDQEAQDNLIQVEMLRNMLSEVLDKQS